MNALCSSHIGDSRRSENRSSDSCNSGLLFSIPVMIGGLGYGPAPHLTMSMSKGNRIDRSKTYDTILGDKGIVYGANSRSFDRLGFGWIKRSRSGLAICGLYCCSGHVGCGRGSFLSLRLLMRPQSRHDPRGHNISSDEPLYVVQAPVVLVPI